MSEYVLNDAQEAWLKALESGRHQQTTGMLRDGAGYCCLGLACKIVGEKETKVKNRSYYMFGVGNESEDIMATERVTKLLKLRDQNGKIYRGRRFKTLAQMNDEGKDFSEIAAFIRSNPTAVFKE